MNVNVQLYTWLGGLLRLVVLFEARWHQLRHAIMSYSHDSLINIAHHATYAT